MTPGERKEPEEVPVRAALRAESLSKVYPALVRGGPELALFRNLDLTVVPGEMVAVVGRSGAGKSSLLHLLAGLDRPSAGEVWVGATALSRLSAEELARIRNRSIGFVWQFHYLLPEFSAAENVALPLLARGVGRREAEAQARLWLERLGLGTRATHKSGELSGGEQQRVAMARALVTGPEILLADEPTGDLDEETSSSLFELMRTVCHEERLAALLVTHNAEIASRCDRTLRLIEGRLVPAGELDPAGGVP